MNTAMNFSAFRHLSIGDCFKFVFVDGGFTTGRVCVKTGQWSYKDHDGQDCKQNYSMIGVVRCTQGNTQE